MPACPLWRWGRATLEWRRADIQPGASAETASCEKSKGYTGGIETFEKDVRNQPHIETIHTQRHETRLIQPTATRPKNVVHVGSRNLFGPTHHRKPIHPLHLRGKRLLRGGHLLSQEQPGQRHLAHCGHP